MKKKELNPVHVALTDKANDLKQTLEEILPKHVLSQLLDLTRAKGSQVGRGDLEKVVGRQKGAFHLAFELVKLKSMLERIPLYSS
jgi:ERCC4-related helicase